MLSQLPFRTMSLGDRGLLYTLRLECWVNMRLPNDPINLAKVLGLPVSEVAESLVAVMSFFQVEDDFIISPELENYRKHLADRKQKQSQGGKLGSAKTNQNRNISDKSTIESNPNTPSSNSHSARQVTRVSLVKSNTEKPSQNQLVVDGCVEDSFLKDYETAEHNETNTYAKESRGG